MNRACLAACVALLACEAPPTPDGGTPVDAGDPRCLRMPAVIDFGEVPTGRPGETTVLLTSATPITRETFGVSHVDAPFALSVRQTGNELAFHFFFTPPDSRLQLGQFTFIGGPGCEAQVVQLRGLGSGSVSVDMGVDFGPIPMRTPVQLPMTIRNTRREEIDVQLTVTGEFTIEPMIHLGAGSTGSVIVTANIPSLGFHGGTATLVSSAGELLRVDVRAIGGVPMALVSPGSIEIPHLPLVGGAVGPTARRVRVDNQGDGVLQLESMTVVPTPGTLNAEIALSAPTLFLSPRSAEDILVQFTPASLGVRTWSLRIATNDPVRRLITIPITANVESIAACGAPVTPQSSVLNVGPPYPRDVFFRLDNPNPGTCLLDALSVSDGPWVLHSPSQVFLDGGASLALELTVTEPGVGLLELNTVGASQPTSIPLVAQ